MVENNTIVGIGVCGAGEAGRYMRKSMEEYKRLCDHILIATCNATDEEKKMLDEYGFDHYEDNREWGIDQPNIKTTLLKKAGEKYNPGWIIAIDMDEVFAPTFTKEKALEMMNGEEIAYYFLVVNLYNDEQHYAHDAGIQRFWNIRFYKYLPELGLEFQRKNLHCGLGPPIMYKYGWHAPFYLLHYGLMKKEDRDKKVQRYNQYDPNARFKDRIYYDNLQQDLLMIPFLPEKLLLQLAESKETHKRKIPNELKNLFKKEKVEQAFYAVDRYKDGVYKGSVEIPAKDLEITLKVNPEWEIQKN